MLPDSKASTTSCVIWLPEFMLKSLLRSMLTDESIMDISTTTMITAAVTAFVLYSWLPMGVRNLTERLNSHTKAMPPRIRKNRRYEKCVG